MWLSLSWLHSRLVTPPRGWDVLCSASNAVTFATASEQAAMKLHQLSPELWTSQLRLSCTPRWLSEVGSQGICRSQRRRVAMLEWLQQDAYRSSEVARLVLCDTAGAGQRCVQLEKRCVRWLIVGGPPDFTNPFVSWGKKTHVSVARMTDARVAKFGLSIRRP